MQTFLKYGIILGVISSMIVIVNAYVSPLGMLIYGLLPLVLIIMIPIMGGREERNLQGGFMSYGEAYKHQLMTMVVAGLIGTLVHIILLLVDPNFVEILKEQALETSRSVMELFNAPEDVIETAIEESEAQLEGKFTVGSMFLNFFYGIIFYAFLSLITALFVKRNNPANEYL